MKKFHWLIFACLLAIAGCTQDGGGEAQVQEEAAPVAAVPIVEGGSLENAANLAVHGITDENLDSITQTLKTRFTDDLKIANIVTMVAHEGEIVYESAIGVRGANDPTPVAKDDLFRIYSMTKPILGVAAAQLVEQGKLDLDGAVKDVIPEFENMTVQVDAESEPVPAQETMTMRQLLTHTAGFGYVFSPHPSDQAIREQGVLSDGTLEDMVDKLGNIPLKQEPGAEYEYSLSIDVVGAVVERLSGQTLDVYLHENIFEPLQMNDTFFGVPEEKIGRFLPVHMWNPEDNTLNQAPEPDATDTYREANVTLYSGGGGLVSTAHDYLRFAEAVRRGGVLDGVRIMKEETRDLMIENHLPASLETGGAVGELPAAEGEEPAISGFGFGLSWGLNFNDEGELQSYFWGGAAGTIFWIDPNNNTSVVSMIQTYSNPHPLRQTLMRQVAVNIHGIELPSPATASEEAPVDDEEESSEVSDAVAAE